MHASLRPRNNRSLIVVWAIAVTALACFTTHPWILVTVGASLGAIAGVLQAAAVRASTEAFLATKTALDVRRAFQTSRPGRLSIQVVWASLTSGIGLPGRL